MNTTNALSSAPDNQRIRNTSAGAAALLSMVFQSSDPNTHNKIHFEHYTTFWKPVLMRYAQKMVFKKVAAQIVCGLAIDQLWEDKDRYTTPEQIRSFFINEIRTFSNEWIFHHGIQVNTTT